MNHTMYIWKRDGRTKSGERLYSTTVWKDRDPAAMLREIADLHRQLYPREQFRIEAVPTMKTVRNLMTGKEVEIPHDTPRSCDPSSELYWSM
jgi:outer membrane protein assembly factor BamD (BamD/ComL family)